MKKTLFTILCAAGLLVPQPAAAAQVYKTQEEAASTVTDDGYILFTYAAGWDRFSEPFMKKVIAEPAIQKAAGNAALILAPLYQYATPDDTAQHSAVWGALEQPAARTMETHPSLLMYDKSGYLYGRVQGTLLIKGSISEVAAEVRKKLEAKKQQEAIMAKAEAASGVEKAKLIAEACAVEGIERPNGYLDMVKSADPGDQSGMVRRLSFDYYGFSQKYCGKDSDGGLELGAEKTIQEMEKFLKDPAYTAEQQQIFHAVIIGTLRRNGASAVQLKGAVQEMKRLAPESHMGVSADQYIKVYASGNSKK